MRICLEESSDGKKKNDDFIKDGGGVMTRERMEEIREINFNTNDLKRRIVFRD